MSIGTTQEEPIEKKTLISKKRSVNIAKVVTKTAEEFKRNTLGVMTFIVIMLTGIGEVFSEMSLRWYAFAFFILIIFAVESFLSNEPLRLFLKINKEKYGERDNNK